MTLKGSFFKFRAIGFLLRLEIVATKQDLPILKNTVFVFSFVFEKKVRIFESLFLNWRDRFFSKIIL